MHDENRSKLTSLRSGGMFVTTAQRLGHVQDLFESLGQGKEEDIRRRFCDRRL